MPNMTGPAQIVLSERMVREGVFLIAQALKTRALFNPDVIVPIMDASLMFAGDVIRSIYPELNPAVAPIKLTRTPRLTDPTRFHVLKHNVQFHGLVGGLKGKRIIVLDTICDTGETLRMATSVIKESMPRSIATVCLIWKAPSVVKPDLYAYKSDPDIKDKFLVGYGLDKEGRHRGCPFIYY